MTTAISFADWVDWLAVELTLADVAAFTSPVHNFERALGSFSLGARSRFRAQFAIAVPESPSIWPAYSDQGIQDHHSPSGMFADICPWFG